MGDIKRKKKNFNRPKKLFDRTRMDEENILVKKYGLKNKREIWKAKTAVSKLRRQAKSLIGQDMESQQAFFDKLNKNGMNVTVIADVLGLTEEAIFERRLQTFLYKKGLANTVKHARQLIIHKNVLVDGVIVNVPSFVITKDLEDKIILKEKKTKIVEEEAPEEAEATAPQGAPSNEGKEDGNTEETEE